MDGAGILGAASVWLLKLEGHVYGHANVDGGFRCRSLAWGEEGFQLSRTDFSVGAGIFLLSKFKVLVV